jgi:hypothetical protein
VGEIYYTRFKETMEAFKYNKMLDVGKKWKWQKVAMHLLIKKPIVTIKKNCLSFVKNCGRWNCYSCLK